MTPQSTTLDGSYTLIKSTDTTYRMDTESLSIRGLCCGRDAVKQAVYKLLMTEKDTYVIYDKSYGVRLKDLFGTDISYARAVIRLRLEDAFKNDERIKGITSFSADAVKNKLRVELSLDTVYGGISLSADI